MSMTCSMLRRDQNALKILVGNPKGRNYLVDLGLSDGLISEWIFNICATM